MIEGLRYERNFHIKVSFGFDFCPEISFVIDLAVGRFFFFQFLVLPNSSFLCVERTHGRWIVDIMMCDVQGKQRILAADFECLPGFLISEVL